MDLGSGFKKIATEDQFPEDLKYLDGAMAIKIKEVHGEATFVESYTEVSEGSWLALVEDDHLKVAISFGHACEIMDCAIGDRLTITVTRSQDSAKAD